MLLVEDDSEIAALARAMLGALGFSAIHVSSPALALDALANARAVEAVFSDIMMPGGISGLDLARESGVAAPRCRSCSRLGTRNPPRE